MLIVIISKSIEFYIGSYITSKLNPKQDVNGCSQVKMIILIFKF